MWPFRRNSDQKIDGKEPCSDLGDIEDRMDALADVVRTLSHEWDLASEALTALKDRVHREVGYIARNKRVQETDPIEQLPAPAMKPRRRSAFSSRKSVGGSA